MSTEKRTKEYASESGQRILDFIMEELSFLTIEPGNSFYAGLIQGEVSALERVRDFAMGVERE
jgi:hypothetical protein